MPYLEVTGELRTKLEELLKELDVIEASSTKTAGKRARVLFTEVKKLNRGWKLALKEREAAYPKKAKKAAAAAE